MDSVARYEQAVNAVIGTLDESSRGDRAYARDLEMAQKTLQRQLQQLRGFQTSARPERTEELIRVADSVTIALDAIVAEQRSLRADRDASHGTHSGSSGGHGCGKTAATAAALKIGERIMVDVVGEGAKAAASEIRLGIQEMPAGHAGMDHGGAKPKP